jgi:ABC-type thiamine transport system substrate-binding protein
MKYVIGIPVACVVLACIICVSCQESPDNPTALALTKQSFDNPQEVGTLPDGRVVKVVCRDMGTHATHYIYFVDGVTTINRNVPQGKTSYNQVVVEIDGVKYVPVEKPNEKD